MLSENLAENNMTKMMMTMMMMMMMMGKVTMNKRKKSGGPRIKEQIFRSKEKCNAITLRKANATIADTMQQKRKSQMQLQTTI
jgi:hypothetical protein